MFASRALTVAVAVVFVAVAASQTASAATITGGAANAALGGTAEADTIDPGQGNYDDLFGRGGDDTLKGGTAGSTAEMYGGKGADTYEALQADGIFFDDDGPHRYGEAADTLVGGPYMDEMWSADGAPDHISCGSDADVVFADASDVVSIDCETVIRKKGTYTWDAGGDSPFKFVFVPGTSGDDNYNLRNNPSVDQVIAGKSGADVLYGGRGADWIAGGSGRDRLYGRKDDDVLEDDDGTDGDRLVGGAGDDYIRSADGGIDRIICGASSSLGDTVYADPDDYVADDCEHVYRVPVGGSVGTL